MVRREQRDGAAGQDLNSEDGQKINLAAAAGVNITQHVATAQVTGTLKASDVDVLAENRANYRTLGTGAAVTPGERNSNCISVGVAVSVNDNEANAIMAAT